ncbi:MAG: ATP-binding protein [Candidatus Paceibacterota bacterium]
MQYTLELLQKVITEGYEDNHIDFKENFNWYKFNDYHKTKLAKHIAAISNIPNGGILIFGVSDSKVIVGLSTEDLKSIDRTWIDNHLSQYLDPLPKYNIKTVEYEDRKLLIFEVDEFLTVPTICKRDYPDVLRAGGVYHRNHASSMLIQDAASMHELLELAVKKKKEALLNSIEDILER